MQHHRGSVQQVHLLVCYPLSLRPIRFPQIDRFPELRQLELRQLARVLLSSDPDPTLGLLRTKIRSYGHGELPHAKDILPALYELMENDESVKEEPFPAPAPPNQQGTGGEYWEGLKKALTSSLTSGTFLDSQFYAVESRSLAGLPKIRPVYFCSTVSGSFASKLAACKSLTWITCGWVADPSFQIRRNSEHGKYHLPDVQMGMIAILTTKILIQRVRQSVTLGQSCSSIRSQSITTNLVCSLQRPRKPYSRKLTDGARTSVEIRGGKDVSHCLRRQYDWLTSRCSWGAMFLYVYTGQITFASLSLQDVTPSEKEEVQDGSQGEGKSPQDSEGLSAPPPSTVVVEPCSPKSVCHLANKVRLAPLRSGAVTDSSFA